MSVLKRIDTEEGLKKIHYHKTPKGTWVCESGRTYFVKSKKSASSQEASEDDVVAPMSGAIISVDVAPGDTVTAGQDLVVLTAMKMEYRLKAPKDGTIKAVNCKLNDLVDIEDILVSMDE